MTLILLYFVAQNLNTATSRAQRSEQALQTTNRILQRRTGELENYTNTLNAQRSQLRALNRRLAEIQEMERKQLARELHDQVGQNLTAIDLNLKSARIQLATTVPATDTAQLRLEDASVLVEEATTLVRNVLADLRPPLLDSHGLLATVKWYAALTTKRSGLPIEIQGVALPRLAEAIELALFRIVQGAVTNIVKHAQATQATIRLTYNASQVWLAISDNGCGFDTTSLSDTVYSQPHWGLLNMHERAEAIGGRCWIESAPGRGVTVKVEVPL